MAGPHLVAEALACAGGEDGERGLACHYPRHRRQLAGAELLVSEHLRAELDQARTACRMPTALERTSLDSIVDIW